MSTVNIENTLTRKFNMLDRFDMGEWPKFKTSIDKTDTIADHKVKRMKIGEYNGRQRKGVKEEEEDYKYFSLLAMKMILEAELSKRETEKFIFCSMSEVFDKYKEIEKKINEMMVIYYIPLLKEEIRDKFKIEVAYVFNQKMKNENRGRVIKVFHEVMWKVLDKYMDDPSNFKFPLTKDDKEYWSSYERRQTVVNEHVEYIDHVTFTSLFLQSQETALLENNKLMTQMVNRLNTLTADSNVVKTTITTVKKAPQISERTKMLSKRSAGKSIRKTRLMITKIHMLKNLLINIMYLISRASSLQMHYLNIIAIGCNLIILKPRFIQVLH